MLKFVDNKKSYKMICSYCVHDPEVYINSIGVELNSHNFLSAVLCLVHPLDSCSQMALLN